MNRINDMTDRILPPTGDWRHNLHFKGFVWALIGEKHPELPGQPGDEHIPGSDRALIIEGLNIGHVVVDKVGKRAARELGLSFAMGMAIVLVGTGLFYAVTFLAVVL